MGALCPLILVCCIAHYASVLHHVTDNMKMTLCGVEFDLPKSLKCEGIIICNPLTVLVPSWVLSVEIYESEESLHIEAKQK